MCQTGTVSGPRPSSATLTTATRVSARNASRSARLMLRYMTVPPARGLLPFPASRQGPSAGCAPVRDAPQDRRPRRQLGHFGETRFAHERRNPILVFQVGMVEEMRDDALRATRAAEVERVEG